MPSNDNNKMSESGGSTQPRRRRRRRRKDNGTGDPMQAITKQFSNMTRLMQKRTYMPKVDMSANPCCAERQLLDQMILSSKTGNFDNGSSGGVSRTRQYLHGSSIHVHTPRDGNLSKPGAPMPALPEPTVERRDLDLDFLAPHSFHPGTGQSRASLHGTRGSSRSRLAISQSLAQLSSAQAAVLLEEGVIDPLDAPQLAVQARQQGMKSPSTRDRSMSQTEVAREKERESIRGMGTLNSRAGTRSDAPISSKGIPSFGHRPGSASRLFDPLSMTVLRKEVKNRKLPKVGLFDSRDLRKMLSKPSGATRRQGSRSMSRAKSTGSMIRMDLNMSSIIDEQGEQPAHGHGRSVSPIFNRTASASNFSFAPTPSSFNATGNAGLEVVQGPAWLGGSFTVGTGKSMFEKVDGSDVGQYLQNITHHPCKTSFITNQNVGISMDESRGVNMSALKRETETQKLRRERGWQSKTSQLVIDRSGTGLISASAGNRQASQLRESENVSSRVRLLKYRKKAVGINICPFASKRHATDVSIRSNLQKRILEPCNRGTKLSKRAYIRPIAGAGTPASVLLRDKVHDIDEILRELDRRDQEAAWIAEQDLLAGEEEGGEDEEEKEEYQDGEAWTEDEQEGTKDYETASEAYSSRPGTSSSALRTVHTATGQIELPLQTLK